MKKLTLAYSPYGGQNDNIRPFDAVFQEKFNPVQQGSLNGADALLLWGGTDIDPSFYNQKPHPKTDHQVGNNGPSLRDLVEWELMREAHRRKIPIIGVCRGAQFLCVFSGGSLIQDVKGHYSAHGITTFDGLSMHASANHHQMMNPLKGTYDLLAWAEEQCGKDKEIEGGRPATGELVDKKIDPEVLWFPEIKGLAIQPHPEWMPPEAAFPTWCNKQIKSFMFKE